MSSRSQVRSAVLDFIARGFDAPDAPETFNELALSVFEHQFRENEPYRRYCERRRVDPASLTHWTEVPAVPSAAFKETALVCGAPTRAEIVFRTSGTTQGRDRRGAHYVRDTSLYRAAALTSFEACMLPDRARLQMLILAPPPHLAPDSSLTWMLERVRDSFGGPHSEFCVDESGLRLESLWPALDRSQADQVPLFLLGTALAFVHLLDALSERGRRYHLPPGSRLMETGGFKGVRRSVGRDEFYDRLVGTLGLSQFYCVSEYGMTEMSSQFYDNVLRERVRGGSPGYRVKLAPPWVRTRVLDAETLQPLPPGRPGVLRHHDLANLDSVAAIQTDDLGVAGQGGFELLGRATGAELRGCSIAIDEWLTAQS